MSNKFILLAVMFVLCIGCGAMPDEDINQRDYSLFTPVPLEWLELVAKIDGSDIGCITGLIKHQKSAEELEKYLAFLYKVTPMEYNFHGWPREKKISPQDTFYYYKIVSRKDDEDRFSEGLLQVRLGRIISDSDSNGWGEIPWKLVGMTLKEFNALKKHSTDMLCVPLDFKFILYVTEYHRQALYDIIDNVEKLKKSPQLLEQYLNEQKKQMTPHNYPLFFSNFNTWCEFKQRAEGKSVYFYERTLPDNKKENGFCIIENGKLAYKYVIKSIGGIK